MISTPEYRIRVKAARQSCFDYEVNFADGRTGSAQIMFFPISIFYHTFFYDHLLKEGLKPFSTLTFINSFYPNGDLDHTKDKDAALMRHGAGSAVLELMITDSIGYEADAMYGSTASPPMARFLREKNKFVAYDDQRFYKLLPKANR